eukprot:3115388-Prymnesium_polylepis.1
MSPPASWPPPLAEAAEEDRIPLEHGAALRVHHESCLGEREPVPQELLPSAAVAQQFLREVVVRAAYSPRDLHIRRVGAEERIKELLRLVGGMERIGSRYQRLLGSGLRHRLGPRFGLLLLLCRLLLLLFAKEPLPPRGLLGLDARRRDCAAKRHDGPRLRQGRGRHVAKRERRDAYDSHAAPEVCRGVVGRHVHSVLQRHGVNVTSRKFGNLFIGAGFRITRPLASKRSSAGQAWGPAPGPAPARP